MLIQSKTNPQPNDELDHARLSLYYITHLANNKVDFSTLGDSQRKTSFLQVEKESEAKVQRFARRADSNLDEALYQHHITREAQLGSQHVH